MGAFKKISVAGISIAIASALPACTAAQTAQVETAANTVSIPEEQTGSYSPHEASSISGTSMSLVSLEIASDGTGTMRVLTSPPSSTVLRAYPEPDDAMRTIDARGASGASAAPYGGGVSVTIPVSKEDLSVGLSDGISFKLIDSNGGLVPTAIASRETVRFLLDGGYIDMALDYGQIASAPGGDDSIYMLSVIGTETGETEPVQEQEPIGIPFEMEPADQDGWHALSLDESALSQADPDGSLKVIRGGIRASLSDGTLVLAVGGNEIMLAKDPVEDISQFHTKYGYWNEGIASGADAKSVCDAYSFDIYEDGRAEFRHYPASRPIEPVAADKLDAATLLDHGVCLNLESVPVEGDQREGFPAMVILFDKGTESESLSRFSADGNAIARFLPSVGDDDMEAAASYLMENMEQHEIDSLASSTAGRAVSGEEAESVLMHDSSWWAERADIVILEQKTFRTPVSYNMLVKGEPAEFRRFLIHRDGEDYQEEWYKAL